MGAMTVMSVAAWREALLALLPPSSAINRQPGGVLVRVLEAMGAALREAERKTLAIIAQFDPAQATDVLDDWERLYGLPDPCLDTPVSIEQRRRIVDMRRLMLGGASPDYFRQIALSLGYANAWVEEFRPMRANSKCNAAINQNGWRFAFRVNVHARSNITRATATSPCTAALRSWGDPGLFCLLARHRPAQTVALVGYDDFQ